MTETIICPDCNKPHELRQMPHETQTVLTYKCPFHDDKDNIVAKVDDHWQISNRRRYMTMVDEPRFNDDYQTMTGRTIFYSFCCRSLEWESKWNKTLEYDSKNRQLLYDGVYNSEKDEFNGTKLETCPFCGTDVKILRTVMEDANDHRTE